VVWYKDNFMAIEGINTQNNYAPGGLIPDLIRFFGSMAGKGKPELTSTDPNNPVYKTGFMDTMYGSPGDRMNRAILVDRLNRENSLKEMSTAQQQSLANTRADIPLRGDITRSEAIKEVGNQKPTDELIKSGGAGELSTAQRAASLGKSLTEAEKAGADTEEAKTRKAVGEATLKSTVANIGDVAKTAANRINAAAADTGTDSELAQHKNSLLPYFRDILTHKAGTDVSTSAMGENASKDFLYGSENPIAVWNRQHMPVVQSTADLNEAIERKPVMLREGESVYYPGSNDIISPTIGRDAQDRSIYSPQRTRLGDATPASMMRAMDLLKQYKATSEINNGQQNSGQQGNPTVDPGRYTIPAPSIRSTAIQH